MKKLRMLIISAALCAGLTACVKPTDIAAEIAQVQAYAQLTCSFVPTAATVLNIISAATGNAALQSVSQIAEAICGAVTRTSVARGGKPPMVIGVPVHGRFVR